MPSAKVPKTMFEAKNIIKKQQAQLKKQSLAIGKMCRIHCKYVKDMKGILQSVAKGQHTYHTKKGTLTDEGTQTKPATILANQVRLPKLQKSTGPIVLGM